MQAGCARRQCPQTARLACMPAAPKSTVQVDVKIEAALESGLNLGHAALDEALAQLGTASTTAAATLAGQDEKGVQAILGRILADQSGIENAMLVAADGKLLAWASEDRRANLAPDLPTPQMLLQAAMPGGYARPEGGIERDFREPAPSTANALDAATGLRLRV